MRKLSNLKIESSYGLAVVSDARGWSDDALRSCQIALDEFHKSNTKDDGLKGLILFLRGKILRILGQYDIALEEFASGNESYITVGTYSNIEGYKAAEMLYEYLENGKPLEQEVFVGGKMLDMNNYKDSSFYPFWKK